MISYKPLVFALKSNKIVNVCTNKIFMVEMGTLAVVGIFATYLQISVFFCVANYVFFLIT